MTFSTFSERYLDIVYVTDAARDLPAVHRARERLSHLPFNRIRDRESVPTPHRNQRTVVVDRPRGEVLGRCPGSPGQLCCNYFTVDLYLGCSIGCTYCIMQSYLNYSPLVVQADPEPVITAIRTLAERNKARPVRVGSGEVGDSLLLDPAFGLSGEIVQGVADLPNVSFESKTKTDYVDHLLALPEKGGAVIGFSVNPPEIIAAEEGIAAALAERFAAAERAACAGYRVAFHFDPIIRGVAPPDEYLKIADRIAALEHRLMDTTGRRAPVAWISLGTVRFTGGLCAHIADRPYLFDEFVPGPDGKYRYLQCERVPIYRSLYERLSQKTKAPIYLCMESAAVWQRVTGRPPSQMRRVRDIFTPVDR